MTANKTNSTELQVTNFDFYGDELIAIKYSETGEVYTAITHILRGIGFTDKQIEHQQKKILNDEILKKHNLKFSGVELNMPSVNEIWCISNRKLPFALAKINITPKMKQKQPELASRLELYQDKCADVLASVFIDNKTADNINAEYIADLITNAVSAALKPIYEKINNLKKTLGNYGQKQENNPKDKEHSKEKSLLFVKLNILRDLMKEDYGYAPNLSNVIRTVIKKTEDTYDISISESTLEYMEIFGVKEPYVIDVILYYEDIKRYFTDILDFLLKEYSNKYKACRKNIFNTK